MFDSTLLINAALVSAAAIFSYLSLKALIEAWKNPSLSSQDAEGSWGWWIEVQTHSPDCLYYFGPFTNFAEADQAKAGYIDDLAEEGAVQITAQIAWCRPERLTSSSESFSMMAGV
jgi:Domain of unknown function (DUF1816)